MLCLPFKWKVIKKTVLAKVLRTVRFELIYDSLLQNTIKKLFFNFF